MVGSQNSIYPHEMFPLPGTDFLFAMAEVPLEKGGGTPT